MKLLGQFAPPLSRRLTVLLAVVLLAGLGFVQSVHLHDELLRPGAGSRFGLTAISRATTAFAAAGFRHHHSSTPFSVIQS